MSIMFTAARLFLPGVHPRPNTAILRCRTLALTAVSARPPRRGPRRSRSWSDDEDGADDRIDDNFFGDARDEEPEPEQEPAEEAAARRRTSSPAPEPTAGQLRGSDVLRALQRAAAAKEAKKKKKAGARPAARRQDSGTKRGTKLLTAAGEVKPIEIRRDWAPRIREMELRVQQLADKYHHSPSRTSF